MNLHTEKYSYLAVIIGSFLAGFSAYFYLSYLFIAPAITVPLSIVLSILVFGLTRYYSKPYTDNNDTPDIVSTLKSHQNISHGVYYKKENRIQSTVIFVTIFVLLIIISSFSYKQDFHVFTSWKDISMWNMIQLGAAIALCFFIPGFAIVLILTKKYKVNRLLSFLLAYLFSILITGLTAYISALTFDIATSDSKGLIISVYVSIIVMFLALYPEHRTYHSINLRTKNYFHYHFIVNVIKRSYRYFNKRVNEFIVFGSLFCLIIILTYYLYGGITIGDQWYHQGRSLLFMSGAFREASVTGAEAFYPPFQSALIAAVTVLSGMPLVNTYASIAFVNIIPVFAFYYFFSAWVPSTMRRAGLLACSLFTISSGFGWIYLLTTTTRSNIFSVQSSLETLRDTWHSDFVNSSNFVINTAPDFSTSLIYIALPAGFALLGIVRTPFQRTSIAIAAITAISVLGIISHYEFYIFIIIASILPIIFNLKARNYVYLSFLLAFFVVTLIDVTAPGAYFSSLKIIGFPLLLLAVSFVIITWIIYLGVPRFLRFLKSKSSHFLSERKFHRGLVRINFHVAILIVSLVAYLYLFSFIVLSQLSMDTIIDHKLNNNMPWYLYPIKMGIAGLFGLAFILSYIFKKFEKEIFVFGVIMFVSFIAGPYYDEYRFTKYFMIGMIGFASLMIYELLSHKLTNKSIIRAVFVSAIITSSALSVLTFIGYNSLILQAQDYTNTLHRRHFPSDLELRVYEFLHNKFDINSNYNVISFLKEYNRVEDGILPKITSFAGFPYEKLRQEPLTLNASTIEALYHHLWFSDARYLIIPRNISNDPATITEPTRFAIEHFKPVYQDGNYTVLEIPPLAAPSSSSDANVALVYDQGKNLQEKRLSNSTLLSYDSKTFDLTSNGSSVIVQKLNQTELLNLFGSRLDGGISVWAKNIAPGKVANYFETGFKITSEDESKHSQIRIKWRETGTSDYYVKLSNDGLDLYKESDTDNNILLKNSEFEKLLSKWYRLKIESLPDSITIYVDDVLKIQAPKTTENNADGISRIGLTSLYSDVQFTPVKIGTVTDSRGANEVAENYDYNYPVSFLALAGLKYDTFSSNDSSIFSKDVILVPDFVLSDGITINRYLSYAHDGGKLIILKSHGSFSSIASKLFSLKSNESNQEAFTHIYDDSNQKMSINIPGSVNKTNTETLPDLHVTASYRNDKNETIAPFIIEKMFPTGGKIILLNSEGYFNALSNLPSQYFSSLSDIPGLLAIDKPTLTPITSQNNSLPTQGFVDKLKISGVVALNSSSLLLDEGINQLPINASRIIIFNKDGKLPVTYNNVSVKDLRLIGDYHVSINFTGDSELPSTTSYGDYIGMQIPNNFNMLVNLASQGSGIMEIVNQNGADIKSISLYNNSNIEFYGMKANTPLNSFPVLVKEPQLKVNGHTYIKKAYLGGYLTSIDELYEGGQLDLEGQLAANFAFVDNFDQPYYNVTKTHYITYLQSLAIDGKLNQDKEEDLKLPGDIYFNSKEKLPLIKILGSPVNIIILSVLIITAIIVSRFLWKKNRMLQP